MPKSLILHIRKFVSLTESEAELIVRSIQRVELKKKEHVLTQGQICEANYFVESGLMRMYINTDEGLEQIVQFAIENWWITDYTSLESKQSSAFNIQAVEKTTLLVLEKKVQEELFEKIPALERYFRKVLQRAYAASLMRLNYIFNESGEERYRNFQEGFPDFVQRVPQYMLASYLGFTPEFLSKVRGKKI